MPGVDRDGHMPLRLALLSDEEMAEHAFVENDKRKDLSPVEEALAYQRRIEDFGYSHQVLAERYGKKRATVSNKLRLLKLPRGLPV
ncbi:MAG: ParB/RepB/Spo0J family partition protein [Bacteroidetes bacterium]|nr:ParB/RepB/Spo0J family partition protein [Bacteroidota bacterium]